MLKLSRNNLKAGFLLLETIITVAILSLGLVFLGRSFIASLDSAKISSDYTQSISLLESKLWELEMFEEKDSSFPNEPASENGDFGSDYEGFSWLYSVNPLEADTSLEELILDVSWVRGRRKGKVSLTTYMYAPQE